MCLKYSRLKAKTSHTVNSLEFRLSFKHLKLGHRALLTLLCAPANFFKTLY